MTGQQSGGGGVELAAMLKDQEESSATLCQEVTKLTSTLQEYQDGAGGRLARPEELIISS